MFAQWINSAALMEHASPFRGHVMVLMIVVTQAMKLRFAIKVLEIYWFWKLYSIYYILRAPVFIFSILHYNSRKPTI